MKDKMGYIQVRSIKEMMRENKRHFVRVQKVNTNSLTKMAKISMATSKEEVSKVNFTGALMSSIILNNIDKYLIRVLATAPHAYAIEKGIPPKTGFVSFGEQPNLRTWVTQKLMNKDPNKANYFLNVLGGVFVGEKGFPYKYPRGIRFMELGYQKAILSSPVIIGEELVKI